MSVGNFSVVLSANLGNMARVMLDLALAIACVLKYLPTRAAEAAAKKYLPKARNKE